MQVRAPRNHSEHHRALMRLVDPAGAANPLVDERVEILRSYVRRRGMSLEHCHIVADRDRIEAACLCLDAPGKTSSILLSPGSIHAGVRPMLGEMIRQAQAAAKNRGVQLLQAMVVPECSDEGLLYAAVGMKHLARLIYMQSDARQAPKRPVPPLEWQAYGRQTHSLFAGVIEKTYEGSLDCGSLNGMRHIEDILASHRATGQFDPALWRIGFDRGEPVGVILLAYMEEQQSHEVAYMGCVAPFRRGGYGSALLAHGFELARARGVTLITLSVDERNTPARKLYERFGFHEMMRRDVWVRLLDREDYGN